MNSRLSAVLLHGAAHGRQVRVVIKRAIVVLGAPKMSCLEKLQRSHKYARRSCARRLSLKRRLLPCKRPRPLTSGAAVPLGWASWLGAGTCPFAAAAPGCC